VPVLLDPSMSRWRILDESAHSSPNSVVNTSIDVPKKLLVLLSSRSLDQQMRSDQQDALKLLKTRNLVFETIDGTDPLQRHR
jgi:hypothetical protein